MPSLRLTHVLTGLAVAAGAVTLALAVPVPRSSAPATATLVRLTTSPVEALGLDAYTGRYGVAESAALGDVDNGDFGDPDGMLDRIGIATKETRTSADPAKNWAQAQLTALELKVKGKPFLRVASLDSYAECVPPPVGPWALAYNRTNSGVISVLGHVLHAGRNEVSVTGAELGAPEVGRSTLVVVVTPFQDPAAQSRQDYARAGLDIDVTASLKDGDGKAVYDGPLTSLHLGEVEAHCGARPPTSSTVPTPSTSPSPTSTTGSPTPTTTGSPTSTTTGSSSAATTTTPVTSSPASSVSVTPVGTPPGGTGPHDGLAGTGVAALPAQAATLLALVAAGLTLLALARRRDRR
ncbi:hypothetical protein [Amycolatopsis vancoresmycina]|uniref:Putative secreted protein n=1 Tax=Amycolatopsis vancoresmycina DSM 44592 TaxID=1292037 RepID=R1IB14_9PSEU|nr:hypothetical protein [Amycolatopsis vancoresmycina]EOD69721.1 putative secreted protein [Amycolatopsis vancoresmycina DSM 44592]